MFAYKVCLDVIDLEIARQTKNWNPDTLMLADKFRTGEAEEDQESLQNIIDIHSWSFNVGS